MKITIKPNPPFNFNLVAGLYARFPTQCVDLYEEGKYKRVLQINNKHFLVTVLSNNSVKKPELNLEVYPQIKDTELKLLKEKVSWIVGADEDIEGFYKIASKDNKFAAIISNLYGLRAPKTPSVFEALIIAISEQQIALPIAIAIRKRLVEKYGKPLLVNNQTYYAFPSPESLAKARVEDIRAMKFSTKKAEYIIDIAIRVTSGKIDLEKMKNWETEKILETLTRIRGLGNWTVEYMMCRGMGRYDALPANDIGLRASVTKFLGKNERVTEQEVRNLLESFGKYKGHAAFYLIYAYAFQKYPENKQRTLVQ